MSTFGFYASLPEAHDRVEEYLPIVESILCHTWTISKLIIVFRDLEAEKGPYCSVEKSVIYLKYRNEYMSEIYGGLLHETIHCILKDFKYRPNGDNFFPEPFTTILQVAVLERIAKDYQCEKAGDTAAKIKNYTVLGIDEGIGNSNSQPLFDKMIRIYNEYEGFDTMRPIYDAMIQSDQPIFTKQNIISELNKIFLSNGVTDFNS